MIRQEPSERPFDMSAVSKDLKVQPAVEKKAQSGKKAGKDAIQKASTNGGTASGPGSVETYQRLLSLIPEFSSFGNLFKV